MIDRLASDDWGQSTEQMILASIGAQTPEARGKLDGFYRTLHTIRTLPEPQGYWYGKEPA